MTDTTMRAQRLRDSFNDVLARLRKDTKASRTTLRIDLPDLGFHVDDPAGEDRDPEVPALTGQTALDQRDLATVRWMDEHHEVLVQNQCRGADPEPPQALIEIYGVQAQMLGPVIRNGHMAGWISIHENRAVRSWTPAEVNMLKAAVGDIHALLDEAGL